jgi:hypothetical protein
VTGITIRGIKASYTSKTGFDILKGYFLKNQITKFTGIYAEKRCQYRLRRIEVRANNSTDIRSSYRSLEV